MSLLWIDFTVLGLALFIRVILLRNISEHWLAHFPLMYLSACYVFFLLVRFVWQLMRWDRNFPRGNSFSGYPLTRRYYLKLDHSIKFGPHEIAYLILILFVSLVAGGMITYADAILLGAQLDPLRYLLNFIVGSIYISSANLLRAILEWLVISIRVSR